MNLFLSLAEVSELGGLIGITQRQEVARYGRLPARLLEAALITSDARGSTASPTAYYLWVKDCKPMPGETYEGIVRYTSVYVTVVKNGDRVTFSPDDIIAVKRRPE